MLALNILFSNDTSAMIVVGALIVLALVFFVIWIISLIDAIKHSKDDGGNVRLILLLLFGSIYGVIYFFTVYRKRKQSDTSTDYTFPGMQ